MKVGIEPGEAVLVGTAEIISLIAAASPGSDNAFEACKDGISRMKKMKSICKDERYL